jgi:tetratricopeptide (TPR) repeat protein
MASSRVNTKFVATLSAVLLALACGTAALAYVALKGRVDKWVAKADALVQQGQYDEASSLYERAVGKDRTRVEWLEKWRDALVKTTPDNRVRYEKQYEFYRGILRTIAVLKPKDADAQRAHIGEFDRLVRSYGLSRDLLEELVEECDDRLKSLDADSPGTTTILRYKAAAQIDHMGLIKPTEEVRQKSLKDIEAAVAANPADHLARIYQARWYMTEAERHRLDRSIEEEQKSKARADELIASLDSEMGTHPEVALATFAARQGERLRRAATPEERLKIVRDMKDDALHVADVALAAPAEQIVPELIDRVVLTIVRVVGDAAVPPLAALVDRTLELHPNDSRMLLAKALLFQEEGKLDEAIAAAQRVIDLPAKPISLEGLMLPMRRMSAMAFQVDCAFYKWNNGTDDAARTDALNQAKRFRDLLEKESGTRGKEVLLVRDAKIAYAERRYDIAVAKIAELRGLDSGEARRLETLQILAQALREQQNYGEARKILLEMVDQAPSLASLYAQLGEVNVRLGNMDEARGNYETASRIEPTNQGYKDRWIALRTALGVKEGDTSGNVDPIVAGILEARKIRDEQGDLVAARAKFERLAATYPDDQRIFMEIVGLDLREGLKDQAIARVEAMLKKYPTNQSLRRTLTGLTVEDPVQAALSFINDSPDLPPALKALERYKILLQAKRMEEAKAALAEAEKLDPENPAVLDMAFVTALGERDLVKAQLLAQTAARLDVDQLGGMLYLGRVQLIEGETNPEKLQAAVSTFEEAVKRVPLNPTYRKLLAAAYQRAGRLVEAADMFKRSVEGKPDDLTLAKDYIGLLIQMNRGAEALAAISPETGILKFYPSNQELLAMWMDLEGRFGNKPKALLAREEMYRLQPTNTANAYALAESYIRDERWDDAQRMIDDLDKRTDVNRLGLAILRANLLANKDDFEGGVKAIQDSIDEQMNNRQKTMAYLSLADFYRRHQRMDQAAAALRKARETQDPALMEADRTLGDMYFDQASVHAQTAGQAEDLGNVEIYEANKKRAEELLTDALVSYEAVYAAVKDRPQEADLLGKRLAETYLRLQRFDKADGIVNELAKRMPDDLQVLLLQGAISSEKGNRRGARQYYDRAVTLNQSNPNPYYQRALFNLTDTDPESRKALLPDILADFDQVTKLRPGLVTAWTRRYTLLREAGRTDESIGVLRSAIDSNPQVDDLRLMLIQDLARAGKIQEMTTEILRAAGDREEEVRWLRLGANVLSQPRIERYRECAELLERYVAKKPDDRPAYRELLDAHLRPGNTPTRQRIQQLMNEFEKDAATTDKSFALFDIMLRARARTYTGQNDLAEKHLSEAVAHIKNEGQGGQVFMSYLIMARGGGSQAIEWLRNRAKTETLNPYLANIVLSSRRKDEKPEKIVAEARELLTRAADDLTRIEINRTITAAYYTTGQYAESADAAREVIRLIELAPDPERRPEYMETLNNLAYTLVTQLDKPAEGLPFAEKAVALNPQESTILDTLGWAYHRTGDHRKAVDVLARASQHAKNRDDDFIAVVHLGTAQLAAGDKAEARRTLRKAEELARTEETRADDLPEYQALFESLRKGLE